MLSKITIDRYTKGNTSFFILSCKGQPSKEEKEVISKINEIIEELSSTLDSSSRLILPQAKKQHGSKQDSTLDLKFSKSSTVD